MVVDTSAMVAALLKEADAQLYRTAMTGAAEVSMSALTVYECRIVLGARNPAKLREFDLLLARLPIEIVPFDADQASLAYRAYRTLGRGSGHPSQLNLSDCAAYALAQFRGEDLLFNGADFARTDVVPALRPT